ncbi:EamA family transporter [Pedobacter helvus]|uniref:EamA family transporter n=1 Tax=Pedobacter helvus TaxID=2563444 RepID=A0ABW9JGF2_9SPHI|nr:EamA family transporter [Pedobacter ureilyticus]
MAPSKSKYLLSGVLSAVIWGFFAIPLRNLKAYPSEQILYYRIFTSLIVIWLAILLFRRKELKNDVVYFKQSSRANKRIILQQIIGATLLLVLNWYTFIYAINNVSIKSGAFAYMVCPLITAFGGFIILKEHLYRIQIMALILATVSILMLATGSLIEVAWSVGIAALYAFYLIIQRKMQHLDKLNVLAVQISIAVILMMPFFIYQHTGLPVETSFWLNVVLIAVLFTVVPLFLSLFALIGIPSSTLGIIIYINPIIAFTVAIFYFNEKIDPHQLIAYLLLLFAVFLFNWNMIRDMLKFKRK